MLKLQHFPNKFVSNHLNHCTQKTMENTIKIKTESLSPEKFRLKFNQLHPDQEIIQELLPQNDDYLNIEIFSDTKSAFKPTYLQKTDIYFYFVKEKPIFSLYELPNHISENCERSIFLENLTIFLPNYLKDDIKCVKSKMLDEKDQKLLFVGLFFYKHNLFQISRYYFEESSKNLKDSLLAQCEEFLLYIDLKEARKIKKKYEKKTEENDSHKTIKDELIERKLKKLEHNLNERILKIICLYEKDYDSIANFIISICNFMKPIDLVFVLQHVRLQEISYLARLTLLLHVYKCLKGQNFINTSVYYATLAYFSINDGYYVDLKIHLKNFVLENVQKNWKDIFIDIFNRGEDMNVSEMNILIHKTDLLQFCLENSKILNAEFTLTFECRAMDALINYNGGFMHGNSDLLNKKTIYFTEIVQIQMNLSEFIEFEILNIGNEDKKINILKKNYRMEKFNMHFLENLKINEITIKIGNRVLSKKIEEINLVKVEKEYSYKIKNLKKELNWTIINIEIKSISENKPRIFGVGVDLNLKYHSNNKEVEVTIENFKKDKILLMLQVSEDIFMKKEIILRKNILDD